MLVFEGARFMGCLSRRSYQLGGISLSDYGTDSKDVSLEIIELLAKAGNILGLYLHIDLQGFSETVLKRMNRKYTLSEAIEVVTTINERLSGCGIGSDNICGFPGECREDVEQAMTTFFALPFSYLHVFPYSERDATAAIRLGDVVPVTERKRRSARWRALDIWRRK